MRRNLIENQEYLARGRESLSTPSGLTYIESKNIVIPEEEVSTEYEQLKENSSQIMEQMRFQKRVTNYRVTSPSLDKEVMEESEFIETHEILKIRDFGDGYSEEETSFFDDKSRYINFNCEDNIEGDRKPSYYVDKRPNLVKKRTSDVTDLISHLNLNTLKSDYSDDYDEEKSFKINTKLANIINNHNNIDEHSILQDSRSPNPYFSKNSQKEDNILSQSSLMQCKESSYSPLSPSLKQQDEAYKTSYPYSEDNRPFLQKITLGHYSLEKRNQGNSGFFDYVDECRDQILVTWKLHQDIEYNEELIDFIGHKVEIEQNQWKSKEKLK